MTDAPGDAREHWKATIRFATQPDDPRSIASQLTPLLEWRQISVDEHQDLEIVIHVEAGDAYQAGRVALDRVQAATAETDFVAPELLAVSVLCLYGGVDPDSAADHG